MSSKAWLWIDISRNLVLGDDRNMAFPVLGGPGGIIVCPKSLRLNVFSSFLERNLK